MSKKDKNKKGFWTEFKEFAIKGNAMALAVGTIIGAAFSGITKSLTDDIIMPVVSIFLGNVKFENLTITLPSIWGGASENVLKYGNFISAVINFFILAFVVFMLVKGLNKLADMGKKKEEEKPAEPPKPSNEEVLLGEIRDLLKNK